MRTVVASDEVATMWARQSQPRAKNEQGNFYFHGNTIFSYGEHFPIARHAEHSGRKCVLLTTREYSVTTARHISETRFAASKLGVPVFHVPVIFSPGTNKHEVNQRDYLDRLRTLALKAKRSRNCWEWHASNFADLMAEAKDYAKFFGLRWRLNRGASVQLELFAARALRAERAEKRKRLKSKARIERMESMFSQAQKQWDYALQQGTLFPGENES